jgi:hypothetical protein
MSIVRSRRSANFTTVGNHIFDGKLSFRAVGVLTYLLSRPDNWSVSVAQLVKHTKASANPLGRDAVYSVLSELEKSGYVKRQPARSNSGSFAGVDYIVFDEPHVKSPHTDLPYTAEPLTANPTLINTDSLINTKKDKQSNRGDCNMSIPNNLRSTWNELADRLGLPSIRVISESKAQLVKDAYKYYAKLKKLEGETKVISIEEFIPAYLDRVKDLANPFHLGENDRGWKMDYGYVFSKKVVEHVINDGILKR